MRAGLRTSAIAVLALLGGTTTRFARATSVEEFPDNGSEQEGRGGAWIARASDPLAAFYNPAGLAGQPTRLTLQANLSTQNTCFVRVKAANDLTEDGVAPGGGYPKVCNSGSFFPDPQVGFTWHVSNRVGLGFLVLGPSAVGNTEWPAFVNGSTPAPSRYMLLKSNVVFLTPTIGVGWEVVDRLRLGASFQAGIAPSINFANTAPALNADNSNPANTDLRAELTAKTWFVPGFTLGALWSPTDVLDVAAWYKYSAPISAKGDIETGANYFTPTVASGNTSKVIYGDTALANCNNPMLSNQCGSGNNASLKVPIPMEAKIGVRYHKRRAGVAVDEHRRDPIADDVFDVEVNFTWANDSAFDYLELHFPSDASGNGSLPATPAIPGAVLPPNADVRHHFRDVFGVRLGGDYNVLPERLALRAGAFVESQAADPQYQNIDFDGAQRIGVALGGTVRVHNVDLILGYGHVFLGTLSNDNPAAGGLPALTGSPCNPTATGAGCKNAQPYRTAWPINLGTITSSINVINVGASYRF